MVCKLYIKNTAPPKRRYGFHGTSCKYLTAKAAHFTPSCCKSMCMC